MGKQAGKNFKNSAAGKALKKEVMELGGAVKTHVKVTGVPAKWKKHMHGLAIEVDEDGAQEIADEMDDIEPAWDSIKDSEVVGNVGEAFQKWGTSAEVDALKALDEEFYSSEEGQELIEEWNEFGEALDDAIVETENGIHIDN